MTTLFKKAWMDMKKTSEIKKDNLFEDPDKTIRRIRNNPYDSRYDDDKEDDEKDTKKAVDNTTARNQHYDESEKSQEETVEKPGDATHSTKWDDCVKEAQAKNPKSNVYAICTAQLGEESFKSQYRHLASMRKEIREARKDVGTSGFAGGIPNSLLADQDLEGVADDSEEAIRDGENR